MKRDDIIFNSAQLTRRSFLVAVAPSGAVLATGAQGQTMVDETSPQATSFGYVADAKRAPGGVTPGPRSPEPADEPTHFTMAETRGPHAHNICLSPGTLIM